MAGDPYVVDLDGASAVVVPDWHSFHYMMGTYCGKERHDNSLRRGADLYILCHDRPRADAVHATLMRSALMVAHDIAIARARIYGPVARALLDAGHAVVADSIGPICDDERLKALYPPPVGPSIDFEWDAGKKVFRMRCLSARSDGSIASERIVLRDDDSWDERLQKGYAKFARRKPLPQSRELVCLPHVAAAVSRLDFHGAARLAEWRRKMEEAGIDAHQDVLPFFVTSASVADPGELVSIEIKGTRGSYLLSSTCSYHGGTTIRDRTLNLQADIPETMAAGLTGVGVDRIWGDTDLSTLRIRNRVRKEAGLAYSLESDVAPLPVPRPAAPDEAASAMGLREIEREGLRVDEVVLALLRPLPCSVRLHIYRTLLGADETRLDISQWIEGAERPIFVAGARRMIHFSSSLSRTQEDGLSL